MQKLSSIESVMVNRLKPVSKNELKAGCAYVEVGHHFFSGKDTLDAPRVILGHPKMYYFNNLPFERDGSLKINYRTEDWITKQFDRISDGFLSDMGINPQYNLCMTFKLTSKVLRALEYIDKNNPMLILEVHYRFCKSLGKKHKDIIEWHGRMLTPPPKIDYDFDFDDLGHESYDDLYDPEEVS